MTARWIERAGWVVFGLSAVFAVFALTSFPVGEDLIHYLDAAQGSIDGRSPYAGPTATCELALGCFPYPPPVALIFVPLLALPPAAAIWAGIAALIGIAAVVGASLVAPLPRALRPWVATGVALFFPLMLEVNLANLNLVTMALALAAWASRDRPSAGGVLLAATVGLKVLGAPLVLFYVAAGRWRQLAWAAATLVAIAIVTAPWVGRYWQEFIPAVVFRATSTDLTGIRPGALRDVGAFVASAVAAGAMVVAAGAAARRSSANARDLHALALAAVPLLAFDVTYAAVVLVLPLLVAVTRALAPRPPLLILPALAWLAMQMPIGMEAWRFGGLVATIALGAALFLPRALGAAR